MKTLTIFENEKKKTEWGKIGWGLTIANRDFAMLKHRNEYQFFMWNIFHKW